MAEPLDVGRVLQVGAGAVDSALHLFVSFFEIAGVWTSSSRRGVLSRAMPS